VIPNGIDTAPLLRLPASDAEPPTIGTYARLWPQKRVDRILHAAEGLAREGRAFDLKILGEGPTRDQLEGLARRLGLDERVTFASDPGGPVQAMPLLDIFVLSSDQEAFPLTPMEAMAAARPVVATRVGAVAEIVEHEVTGLLVDPRDDSALVAALRRLLDEPALRARLGAAARARAEERFDVSVMAQRLDAVYRAAR
jgi:glycosyltransferase involved in cell wall biosynthesis